MGCWVGGVMGGFGREKKKFIKEYFCFIKFYNFEFNFSGFIDFL